MLIVVDRHLRRRASRRGHRSGVCEESLYMIKTKIKIKRREVEAWIGAQQVAARKPEADAAWSSPPK
jgi:hypothetical protein